MPKDLTVSQLLDIYGGLLSEKQRLLCEFYYNDDLSLAEISENEGITRQGVRDAVKRAEQQLKGFEDVLGLYKNIKLLRDEAQRVKNGADCEQLLSLIDKL